MLDFFRDKSRKPFILSWIILGICILDIFAGLKWYNILSPYFKGIYFEYGISDIGQVFFPGVFFICLLFWPQAGILIVFLYIIIKVLFYCSAFGIIFGASIIKDPAEIPIFLIIWEIFVFIMLITYLIKKNIIIKSMRERDTHQVVDIGNQHFLFDKKTGNYVKKDYVQAMPDCNAPH